MKKNIPPLDLLFYLMETHDNPKHVACVQIFQMPADVGDTYLVDLADKLRKIPAQEPFNFKPVFPRAGMPQWHSVENMEMAYHLRHSALPKPGTMKQLITVVQRLHVGILDRERPGWICQIIEGLEGNRFAIYFKIHHAYIDGMSAVRRIYGAFSLDPGNQEPGSFWGYQSSTSAGGKNRKRTAGQLRELGKAARTQVRAISQLNKQILNVGMELANLRKHTGHIPFRAPRTKINDPVDTDFRSMGITSMPLDQLKQIGQLAGCTLNDVVLAIVDAALHDYLARHNDDPGQPLVAMCPMALRDASDDAANTQVATLLVELGQPGAGLRERLDQVARSARGAKDDAREVSKEGLIDFVLFFGGTMELLQRTGLDRVLPQTYNVLVSNVPGPGTEDMYLMGSRLEAIYPLTTLTPGNNLNITVLSHGNSLDFGLLAARGTLPDIDYLVGRLNEQFAALAREFGVTARIRRKVSGKKKTPGKTRAKSKARATALPKKSVARAKLKTDAKTKTKTKTRAKTRARPKARA
jgi:WS/DGAT/MGAT family acyltransferase